MTLTAFQPVDDGGTRLLAESVTTFVVGDSVVCGFNNVRFQLSEFGLQ